MKNKGLSTGLWIALAVVAGVVGYTVYKRSQKSNSTTPTVPTAKPKEQITNTVTNAATQVVNALTDKAVNRIIGSNTANPNAVKLTAEQQQAKQQATSALKSIKANIKKQIAAAK